MTSLLELKLDINTIFEWQRLSQDSTDVPHYQKLLEFINLRAQASEAAVSDSGKKPFKMDNTPPAKKNAPFVKSVASHIVSANPSIGSCVACQQDSHLLFMCSKFKALSHAEKMSMLKANNLCINCLRPGHFVRGCKSLHKCKVCQKPHHSLLHVGEKSDPPPGNETPGVPPTAAPILTHAIMGIRSDLGAIFRWFYHGGQGNPGFRFNGIFRV